MAGKRKGKPKFRVGQVVAFRARQEILYRYGRIHSDLGSIYDYTGLPEPGWKIIEGNHFYCVPETGDSYEAARAELESARNLLLAAEAVQRGDNQSQNRLDAAITGCKEPKP